MPAEPPVIVGTEVTLVPVDPGRVGAILAGDLGDRSAGPGWPHDDTEPALAFAGAGGSTWLVVDADGRVVGEIGTKSPPGADGTVEMGYGLAAASRGRGLGTRAVAALLGWLDEQTEVRRVVAHVAVGNVASTRLLDRLGFTTMGDIGGGELGYERPTAAGARPR